MPDYRTPGVKIEEISSGPRPVADAATTETGFVGMFTLPTSFHPGRGKAAGMFLPGVDDNPQLSWARGIAFRGLFPPASEAPRAAESPKTTPEGGTDAPAKADKKGAAKASPASTGNRLKDLIAELLPGRWDVEPPTGQDVITLKGPEGRALRVPVRRTLVSEALTERGEREWDLAFGVDEQPMVQLIAQKAVEQGIKHHGELRSIDPSGAAVTLDVEAIHDALIGPASAVHSVDGFEQWLDDTARGLFVQLTMQSRQMPKASAETAWEGLAPEARSAWRTWVRTHPGLRRLELGVRGFFANGGRTAFLTMGVQGGTAPDKRQMLERSFDGVSAMAMICSPGLDLEWQRAILEYAGPRGRGDLFAVLETPRYLLTREPRGLDVDRTRWTRGAGPYEMLELQTLASPDQTELRFAKYAEDEVLDRCVPRDDGGYGAAYGPWLVVENPLTTGPHDRYVIAPPSGHVAGVIAATDLRPGGGVHKAPANEQVVGVSELVTSISDREQAALNSKGINIIRHRPGAGIRIWGARTVASDPLWTYVNVRRLFLFVERSVRDAIQWAVFLPNSAQTRSDLRGTITSFLYRMYMQGMLDGATWKDAFSVRCDADNNPDTDVRVGLLTVDVELRPVFPAEFVRVRFRQSPMRSEVLEG